MRRWFLLFFFVLFSASLSISLCVCVFRDFISFSSTIHPDGDALQEKCQRFHAIVMIITFIIFVCELNMTNASGIVHAD